MAVSLVAIERRYGRRMAIFSVILKDRPPVFMHSGSTPENVIWRLGDVMFCKNSLDDRLNQSLGWSCDMVGKKVPELFKLIAGATDRTLIIPSAHICFTGNLSR